MPDSWCYGSGMWNELACSCFTKFYCAIACPIGQELDPTSGCSCVDRHELRDQIYPSWASDYEIAEADSAMYEFSSRVDRLWHCYFETCDEGFYWDQLGCSCFSSVECFTPCPEGQYSMPNELCGCTENEQDYYNLFPEWATDEDIELSRTYGILAENYQN